MFLLLLFSPFSQNVAIGLRRHHASKSFEPEPQSWPPSSSSPLLSLDHAISTRCDPVWFCLSPFPFRLRVCYHLPRSTFLAAYGHACLATRAPACLGRPQRPTSLFAPKWYHQAMEARKLVHCTEYWSYFLLLYFDSPLYVVYRDVIMRCNASLPLLLPHGVGRQFRGMQARIHANMQTCKP